LTVRKLSDIYYEIEGRLNSENTCFCSVKSFLSSCFLSKYLKIKIYKTSSAYFLCCCETLCITLRDKHKLRAFEKVLRTVFGLKKGEVTGV
jgi:hypothetical protein